MIVWPGDEMHEGIRRYLSGIKREIVPENERCVGCDENRATDTGWCLPCWATIEPSVSVAAVTHPRPRLR